MEQPIQNKQRGLGDEIYSGSAAFGRVYTIISAVITTLISIAMIAIGIYMLVQKSNPQIEAKIENAECNRYSGEKNEVFYSCTLSVRYTVDGNEYTGTVHESGKTHYMKGEIIKLEYDPANPHKIKANPVPKKTIGWILLSIGIVLLFMAWLWVWLTQKFKFAAASTGVATGVGMIGRAF